MGAPKVAAAGPVPGGAAVPKPRAKAILASARRPTPPPRVAAQQVKAAAVLTAPVTWLMVFLLIPLVLVALVGLATVQATYPPDITRPTLSHYIAVFNPSGEAFRLLMRSLLIAVEATRLKISEVLQASNVRPWEEVRDQLNRVLRGWAAYFSQGTRLMANRAVDHHVYTRVRLFLIRRHKVPSRGAGRYPDTEVFGALGVLRLRSLSVSPLT